MKGEIKSMVSISKDEAQKLRQEVRGVHIVRFCKTKSKRHHYCVEEIPAVLNVLAEMRQCSPRDIVQN
ncbi:hypothetical protein [Pseudobutyrivibrio sp.]|jgi:hypothetical protein|uniref:hypothetical protein n=1 Tax=Pseudobutyrivibrio sp. TaxID=2014367 RepID=UPI003868DA13